jgi:hypothetical protein
MRAARRRVLGQDSILLANIIARAGNAAFVGGRDAERNMRGLNDQLKELTK